MDNPVFKFSSCSAGPFAYWETINNKPVMKGPMSIVFEIMVKALINQNTSYDVIQSDDLLGKMIAPGNWTGALGLLVNKEVDALLFGCMPEEDLENYIHYSTPFIALQFAIMTGPPLKISEKSNFIFSTIGFNTMLCFFVSWITITVVYYLANLITKEINITKSSFIENLVHLLGLLFKIGIPFPTKDTAGRMVLASWLFCTFVLTTMLSTTLFSRLSVTDVPERINDVKDLLKHAEMKPYIITGVKLDTFLPTSTNPDFLALWKQIQRHEGMVELFELFDPEVMEEVYMGRAAVITNDAYIMRVMINLECQRQKRKFYISKESVLTVQVGLCYRKEIDKKYMEAFNQA